MCNTIAPSMVFAPLRVLRGLPPAATGGTIADGYYQLREINFYGVSSPPPFMSVRWAAQVTRGRMEFVIEPGGPGSEQRASFDFMTGGNLFRLVAVCGEGVSSAAGQYSARSTGFDLFIDGDRGETQQLVFSR